MKSNIKMKRQNIQNNIFTTVSYGDVMSLMNRQHCLKFQNFFLKINFIKHKIKKLKKMSFQVSNLLDRIHFYGFSMLQWNYFPDLLDLTTLTR